MAIDPYRNCNFDTPGYLCTLETCCLAQSSFTYRVNLPGNLFFATLFGLLIIPQLAMAIRYRIKGYAVAMIFGLAFEVIGYTGRIQLHYNPFNALGFYMYLIALTFAPVFTCAAIYLCLARIIGIYGPHLCRLAPRFLALSFMVSDFLSLVLQAAGGAFAAMTDGYSSARIGANVMIAGLILQVVSLAVFLLICSDFARRCRGNVLVADPELTRIRQRPFFKAFLLAIGLATFAILIRSVYRAVELWQGFSGKLWNDEPAFMVLDGGFVGFASILLSIFHPGLAFAHNWAQLNWSFRTAKSEI